MTDTTQYVLVTTKHRGVFAGVLDAERDDGRTVVLTGCRCAIRFGTSGGFLELADKGPTPTSKIGSTAPRVTLYDVTSLTECSDAARKAWESA